MFRCMLRSMMEGDEESDGPVGLSGVVAVDEGGGGEGDRARLPGVADCVG